jgi:hypothetical protein
MFVCQYQSFDKFVCLFFSEIHRRAHEGQHRNVGGGIRGEHRQRNGVSYSKDHEFLQENVTLDIHGGSGPGVIE